MNGNTTYSYRRQEDASGPGDPNVDTAHDTLCTANYDNTVSAFELDRLQPLPWAAETVALAQPRHAAGPGQDGCGRRASADGNRAVVRLSRRQHDA